MSAAANAPDHRARNVDWWDTTADCSPSRGADLEGMAVAATSGRPASIGLDLHPGGRPAAIRLPVLVARLKPRGARA